MEAKLETKQDTPKGNTACAYREDRIEPVTKTAKPGYLCLKRGLDIAVSLVALLLLFIPMLLISLAVWLETPGPAIFKQQRMGRNGKPFAIYKFRTMKNTAPSDLAAMDLPNPDQHVTKLGSILRHSSIDELPQLINVLKGDMSLVGYRPVCLTETALNDLRMRCGVFMLRPGITGLAQVKGRDKLHYTQKVELDAQYVSQCSLKLDIWCLLQTVRIVITGEGVN